MRERFSRHFLRLFLRLGLPLGVGLVLGLIGPFGTYDTLPTGRRLAYWLAVVSANWLLADVIVRRVGALAAEMLPVPRLFVPLSGACLAALPATGIVAMANGLSGIGWPANVTLLFGQVLLLLIAITLPVYSWEITRKTEDVAPDAPDAVIPDMADAPPENGGLALFAARLSKPLEGRLLCLEMQDHYLVVHHTGGSAMILCRMEDAARELHAHGRRVHRSWWVAADAVAGPERAGQRTFLRLTDDRRIPVGRSFKSELGQAGWL